MLFAIVFKVFILRACDILPACDILLACDILPGCDILRACDIFFVEFGFNGSFNEPPFSFPFNNTYFFIFTFQSTNFINFTYHFI